MHDHFWQLNIWLYSCLLGKAWSIILCCSAIWNTATSSVACARTLFFLFAPVCNWLNKWRCQRYRSIKKLPKLPLNLRRINSLCCIIAWSGLGVVFCWFFVFFFTSCGRQNTLLFWNHMKMRPITLFRLGMF